MNLLPIKISDDNKKLVDLPNGVFGYIGANGLHKFEKGFDPINLTVRADINKTARKTEWYFKINKYSPDKITFTGYISDQADSLINQKKDVLSNDIHVYPLEFKEYIYEREFNLNDKDLVIRPRYISTDGPGKVQWLVDVQKEKSAEIQPINFKENEVTEKSYLKEKRKWFSMDNPLVYIPVICICLILTILITYYLYKIGFNPETKN